MNTDANNSQEQLIGPTNEKNSGANVCDSGFTTNPGDLSATGGYGESKTQLFSVSSVDISDEKRLEDCETCMDNCMNFIINTNEMVDDDDTSVSLAFNSTTHLFLFQSSNFDCSFTDNFTETANDGNESLDCHGKTKALRQLQTKQQQQQQQQLQQQRNNSKQQQTLQPDSTTLTENGNVNLDTFRCTYSSCPARTQSEGMACGSTSELPFSIETQHFGSSISPTQMYSYAFSESDGVEKEMLNSQTRRELDDAVRSNLFVSGLHHSVSDAELYNHFKPYGEIESAKVMLDIYTGKSRGIAFIKYTNVSSAEKAIAALHNSVFHDEILTVRVAKPNAAYHPGAPTNKTFVRNIPLSVTKADLIRHFGRYGKVFDVSVHSDMAQRPNSSSRNVAFITYTTKEAAAKAARETHTTKPFPDCEDIPLLAKVAEDSAHRIERLARRGISCNSSVSSANGNFGGGSRSSVMPCYAPMPVDKIAAGSTNSYRLSPQFPPSVVADNYNCFAPKPGCCAPPFFSMAAGQGSAPQFVFVGPDAAPSMYPLPYMHDAPHAMAAAAAASVNPVGPPTMPLVLYPQGSPAFLPPQQPTFVYYVPGEPTPLAARP